MASNMSHDGPRTRPEQDRQDLILIPFAASVFGFVSGLLTSSRLAARQFLAENAHRLPTTVQGWYFYQKTKNYRVMYYGLLGGFKTGGRIGLWTASFVGLQNAIDLGVRRVMNPATASDDDAWQQPQLYPTRWASGASAGLSLAAIANYVFRLSKSAAPRRLVLGTGLGLVAGGSQDLRDWLKTRMRVPERLER
ncbi:hypothetical protein OIO90_000866 [Microbotryomycetes sp. JL221]|nr:hypothetical protein OIO90_000866 [Microbotryomycetes sp. JL221]